MVEVIAKLQDAARKAEEAAARLEAGEVADEEDGAGGEADEEGAAEEDQMEAEADDSAPAQAVADPEPSTATEAPAGESALSCIPFFMLRGDHCQSFDRQVVPEVDVDGHGKALFVCCVSKLTTCFPTQSQPQPAVRKSRRRRKVPWLHHQQLQQPMATLLPPNVVR